MLLFALTATFECLLMDSLLGLSVLVVLILLGLSVLVVLILLGLSVLITSWRTNITEPVRTDNSSLGLFMSCHHMCHHLWGQQLMESQVSIKRGLLF